MKNLLFAIISLTFLNSSFAKETQSMYHLILVDLKCSEGSTPMLYINFRDLAHFRSRMYDTQVNPVWYLEKQKRRQLYRFGLLQEKLSNTESPEIFFSFKHSTFSVEFNYEVQAGTYSVNGKHLTLSINGEKENFYASCDYIADNGKVINEYITTVYEAINASEIKL
jgi:hypothetical protein